MRAQKVFKYVIRLVIAVNLMIFLVVFLLNSQQPKVAPLPNPNGYDDFVRAGQVMGGIPYWDTSQMTEGELREAMGTNAESLKFLRVGLGRECRVPLEPATHPETNLISELSDMKHLAMLMDGEGQLAEMEHRTNDAARIYLELARFGLESTRGGLVLHALVGVVIQNLGITGLRRVTVGLDPQASHRAISELVALDQKQETVSEIMAREKNFQHRVHGFRLMKMITEMIDSRSLDPQKEYRLGLERKTATLQRQIRLDAVSLAAHAYALEKGAPPKAIADLVPAYLKAVPIDPATGTNLVYKP